MTEVPCPKDTLVVKEGKSEGGDMFVTDSGELEVVKGNSGE